jgi:PmbA protein
MLNEILSIAEKYVDSAEVYYLENNITPVNFEFNKLKSIESKETRGISLRVIKNGKLGFSTTTDLDTSNFDKLVKNAIEISEYGPEVGWNFPSHKIESFSLKMRNKPSLDYMIKNGENILNSILEDEKETLNHISINYSSTREIIMNTNGISAHREYDKISVNCYSQLVRDNDIFYVYDGFSTRDLGLNYSNLLEKIIFYLKHGKALFEINTKKLPVIFTNKALNSLLIPLEPALNGKSVLKGSSYFKDKLNTKVFDERLNIYEGPLDGLIPVYFDDEGIPTCKKHFIENGILKSFYYDIDTSYQVGLSSTGNGFRSGLSEVSPSISTLIIEGGDKTFDEMLSEIDEGLLIDGVLGAGQGNTLAGDFSVNISQGYLIEKGKIIGRIKDCMVAGNTFDLFKNNIKYIENKSHWSSSGNRKYPSILFSSMNIVSKR